MTPALYELEIYENERHLAGKWSATHLLPTDWRRRFSSSDGTVSFVSLNEVTLAPGWSWQGESTWLLEKTCDDDDDGGWRYATSFISNEDDFTNALTPFCWVRRRRYTRKIFFQHAFVTRNVELYENERQQLGLYSKDRLLPTDRRHFSSSDGKLNYECWGEVETALPAAGWAWEEKSEWVADWTQGDGTDDWAYAADFGSDDSWYRMASTAAFAFVRRRRFTRRMIFSLAAYEEWADEPAQARRQRADTDRRTHRQHVNWALVAPPFAQLFVGPSSFYLDASEATVGRLRRGTGASTPPTSGAMGAEATAAEASPGASIEPTPTPTPTPATVFQQRLLTAQDLSSLRSIEL